MITNRFMKYIPLILPAVLFFLVLPACSKHLGDEKEQLPTASIIFLSPDAGSVYENGDSVIIKAKAISSETIHGYTVTIKKINDTNSLFSTTVHEHNDTLNISQAWKINFSKPAQFEA